MELTLWVFLVGLGLSALAAPALSRLAPVPVRASRRRRKGA